MQIIDTHCHLDEESLRGEVGVLLHSAASAGVCAVITIGTDAASSRRSLELAQAHPGVRAAVGIHPNYCSAAGPGDWESIEELAAHPLVAAIGETGLDRYWDHAPLELQREYFRRHLDLARRTGKPFIVHNREADAEVREILTAAAAGQSLSGVMHSFCQSAESAAGYLRLGLSVSFTGMLTFGRNEELRATAAGLPADRVMVETDAPYLAPVPFRGKRNEPAYVRHTLACLAAAQGRTVEEMAQLTTGNACRLFGLSSGDFMPPPV